MKCSYSPETIEKVIEFHGHSCPGLMIGIRAAELAQSKLGPADEADLVSVVETDMCGVDAIQFLLSTTFGKGNLVHRDYGKMAFSFFNRKTGEGFRAVLNPKTQDSVYPELRTLMKKIIDGTATEEEKARSDQLRADMKKVYMNESLENMFSVETLKSGEPRKARILESLRCDECGEMTMESRTRRFGGKTLCIPCFEKVEQKI
jgi:formylmethanofuran dehydrogenase subunit E